MQITEVRADYCDLIDEVEKTSNLPAFCHGEEQNDVAIHAIQSVTLVCSWIAASVCGELAMTKKPLRV